VGSLDKPGSPFGEAMQAFHSELNGRSKASAIDFRQRILSVTSSDLKRVTENYLRQDLGQTAVITNVDLAANTGLEIMAV
jgi:Zn-dependent M16 (insulinase) family peptidase